MSEARKNILIRKLAEFEAELEKKRLNLLAVTVLAVTILSAPGGIGATTDIAAKLVTNVLRAVGEAKLADDETRRLPSSATPMVITGPRKESDLVSRPANQRDMDDDIPF